MRAIIDQHEKLDPRRGSVRADRDGGGPAAAEVPGSHVSSGPWALAVRGKQVTPLGALNNWVGTEADRQLRIQLDDTRAGALRVPRCRIFEEEIALLPTRRATRVLRFDKILRLYVRS